MTARKDQHAGRVAESHPQGGSAEAPGMLLASKVAVAVSAVLMLVTLGMACWTWIADNKVDQDLRLVGTMLFAVASGVVLFLTIRSETKARRLGEMVRRFPDQPWRRWHGWATPSIPNQAHRRLQIIWLFVLGIGTVLYGYLIELAVNESFHRRFPMAFMAIAAIPACGLAYVANAQWVWFRYGRCRFVLDTFPAGLGGTMNGRLLVPRRLNARKGFQVRLCLIRRFWVEPDRVDRRHGRSRHIAEEVLWKEEQHVWQEAPLQVSSAGIPVSFQIPADQTASSFNLLSTGWVWRIEFRAKLPGVDFFAQFPIPVLLGTPPRQGKTPHV